MASGSGLRSAGRNFRPWRPLREIVLIRSRHRASDGPVLWRGLGFIALAKTQPEADQPSSWLSQDRKEGLIIVPSDFRSPEAARLQAFINALIFC
jgi:hypothetical protein